ncbi:MAG: chitobiase/beta-hexosaminidase C-terminal domain-containing protein [Myxococcales bacterium]|nr:chitobiase/beta-hexosaminidase C-terminal domain-containing protein [Myxococcales bacterium]
MVVLQTDEPATIYYTNDGTDPTTASASATDTAVVFDVTEGTEVRFFAVDLAGNTEAVHGVAYTVDLAGPGAVTGLTASLAGADVTVAWTNPTDADFAGVVVARGPVARDPEDGVRYAVGDALPGGAPVLYVGTAAGAADTLTGAGRAEYAVWTFDDLGNYGPMRVSNPVEVALPAQQATLSVALTTQVVTVTAAPADLTLAATAVYDDAGDTVTISLDVTNDTSRVLSNLKAVATALGEGTITTGSTWQGDPVTAYGPEALAPGQTRTRSIVITGVTGAQDPLTVDLDFLTHPSLVANDSYGTVRTLDSSGASSTPGTINADGRIQRVAVDATARFAIVTDKQFPILQIIDLSTLEVVADVQLGPWGSIGGLAVIGQRVYAAYSGGAHVSGSGGNESGNPGVGGVEIVAVDLTTMSVVERFTLIDFATDGADGPVARGLALSPDGSRAAVTVARAALDSNELWLVDLGAMAVEAGAQPIALSATPGRVTDPVWSEDGATIAVTFDNYRHEGAGDSTTDAPIERVDVATGALSSQVATSGARCGRGVVMRGGKTYFVSGMRDTDSTPLTVFDGAGGQTTPDPGFTSFGARAVVFDPSGTWYYVASHPNSNQGCQTATFDASDDTLVDRDGDGTTALAICARHSGLAVTPF